MTIPLSKNRVSAVNQAEPSWRSVSNASGVWFAGVRRPGNVRDATASSVLTWPVIGKARKHGLKVEPLLEESDLRPSELLDSHGRIPLHKLQRIWEVADRQLGIPDLGLSILSDFDATKAISWPEPLSLFEHLFRASANVREGIERSARYTRLLRDHFHVHMETGADGRSMLSLELTPTDPFALVQFHLGMAVVLGRRVLPTPPQTDEVWLTHQGPHDTRGMEAFFGGRVCFGAPLNGLVGATLGLDTPLPTADGALARTLDWRADSLMAALPDPGSTVDRLREALRRVLPDGDVRVEAIAKRLALSPRTLHRRLHAENESYQAVLDQLRCELAKRDLACGRYSVREVGQRVGFTSLSAFYRAFKTWTGRTPAEFQHHP